MNDDKASVDHLPAQVQAALGEVSGFKVRAAKLLLKIVGSTAAREAMFQVGDDLDTLKGRSIVSDAMARAVAGRLTSDPHIVERACSRFWEDQVAKQDNLEAIVAGAASEIALLPAPSSSMEDKEQTAKEVSDDWRRRFAQYAADVSDSEVQGIWSRMLAGEFQSPGAFSFRTLRILSELDRQMADEFVELMQFRFADDALFEPHREFHGGRLFALVSQLRDQGLLTDMPGQATRRVPKDKHGAFLAWGRWYGAVLAGSKREGPLMLPQLRLSEAGRQLCRLLPPPDEAATMERIALKLLQQCPDATVVAIGPFNSDGLQPQKFIRGDEDLLLQLLSASHP